jgi:hypothetical protein
MTNQSTSMPRSFLPRVQSTLSLATCIVASVGALWLLFEVDVFSKYRHGLFSPYLSSILLTIYLWQFIILRSNLSNLQKRISFGLLLSAALPFIYWRCFPVPTIEINTFGHIIGNPIWVLPIPIASFFLFNEDAFQHLSEKRIALWICQIVVAFAVWTAVWSWILILTGLATSWQYGFSGC